MRGAARLLHVLWPSLLTGTLLGAGALGLTLLPSLVTTAPMLLVALRPTWSVLLLVGGQVPFLPTLLLASFFRALVDVGYFGLARNNVRSLLLRRVGTSRLVTALSRRGTERPLLWFCLVNTNIAVDAALGAGSVPARRFLRFLIPGTLLSTSVYLLAAGSLAPWMRDVVTWIDGNASLLILGGVGLAACHAAALALRARRRRRQTGHADGVDGPGVNGPNIDRADIDRADIDGANRAGRAEDGDRIEGGELRVRAGWEPQAAE